MNKFEKMYEEKKMTAEQALSLIQDYDYMFSAQAAGEPAAIMSKLQYLKETGVKNTTLNTCLPLQYYDAFKDPEMTDGFSVPDCGMPMAKSWLVPFHRVRHLSFEKC